MSGIARRIRRRQLVRANTRDEVLLNLAGTVQAHDQILDQIIQALSTHGIRLGETKSESGLVVLPPGARLREGPGS